VSYIIVCPNCGQKNRIHDNEENTAKCGKCWTSLVSNTKESFTDKKLKSGNVSYFFQKPWFLWLILFVSFFIFIAINDSKSKTPIQNIKTDVEVKKEVKNTYPTAIMPYTGEVKNFILSESIAPLTIQTSAGANYLVKIVDYYSKSEVMTVFVRGGDTARVKVPLGEYEIKYASGKEWYGYQHLFGDKTSYSKADSLFKFENTGYQITGYTITLFRVSNGNLRTSYINQSEF